MTIFKNVGEVQNKQRKAYVIHRGSICLMNWCRIIGWKCDSLGRRRASKEPKWESSYFFVICKDEKGS
jgi:hypothetical protein